MSPTIWQKYTLLKEINNNSNVKTYLTKLEPIMKEIMYKDLDEYLLIRERIEKIRDRIKIFDIIDEKDRLFIIIDNNNEMSLEFDKFIGDDIQKEGILKDQGGPITKKEILNVFNMEKSTCRIIFEKYEDNNIKKGIGSGFFCEIDNFPIKHALFTNNHILDENNIKTGKIINIEYLKESENSDNSSYIEKEIKIDEKRRVYTNKELDYTCIEIYESDGFKWFYKIDPVLFLDNNNCLENSDIFILQYPKGNEISFSYGKIKAIKNNNIIHSASTEAGSSGSPIIRRTKNNYIIGLHRGAKKGKKKDCLYNLATRFDSILYDINKNEILCIYEVVNNEKEIQLLNDYNLENYWKNKEFEELYLEAKKINKKFFEKNIEIFINDKKLEFDYKYKVNKEKEIKVKYKFKKNLNNASFMFFKCSSLKSINLSSFDASKITKMVCMFSYCSSLTSIDLSSFNTNNVIDMSNMFSYCSSLTSLDLSSFNTSNVKNMSFMFDNCSSLFSVNLSTFNTINVNYMNEMFFNCSSLTSMDLSSFNTINVISMRSMFCNCGSLDSIIFKFNTKNVIDMGGMFKGCKFSKYVVKKSK